MRGSRPRSSRARSVLLVALAWLAARAPAAAQQGVEEAFAEGRYELALEAIDGLSDPILAAEWRFQVLHAAGDYPGALRAAREGLRLAPDNLRLLQNAANCALTLGEGKLAAELCERWRASVERSSLAPEQREADLTRVARYGDSARAQLELDSAAAVASRRARWTTLALLGAVLVALVALSRRPNVMPR